MTRIQTNSQEKFNSSTIKVETPDGDMFVTIMENDSGRPCRVHVTIGKAGASIAAWSQAIAEMINSLLVGGKGINDIIVWLSQHTSSKPSRSRDIPIRSGPDGIVVALMEYRRHKFEAFREKLGGLEDFDDPNSPWMGDREV